MKSHIFINGKRNGLCIGYHPNGVIYFVGYYFNDMLWETISLIDSSGIQYYPGSLVNGNGTVPFLSNDGKNLGFGTYKDGHLDGAYYHIDRYGRTAIKGQVKFSPDCANYIPALKVKYVNKSNDTIVTIIDIATFTEIIKPDSSTFKILSTVSDSLLENPPMYESLNESFGDSRIVPIGKWKLFDTITNKTLVEFEFDNCGNETLKITYNDDGTIGSRYIQQPHNKRRITKK